MPRLNAAFFTVMAAVLLASLMVTPPSQAKPKPKTQFAGMTMHVFLAKSGRFSKPISQVANFNTWNFVVSGSGIPAGERFNSVLLRIALRADGEVFASGPQLVVTVRERGGPGGKRRSWRFTLKDIYVPNTGRVFHAVMIREIGCQTLDVTVQSHARTWRKAYVFRCGE